MAVARLNKLHGKPLRQAPFLGGARVLPKEKDEKTLDLQIFKWIGKIMKKSYCEFQILSWTPVYLQ